jgi:hypothetical protein
MLYALRYQKQATSNIALLVGSLKEQGVSAEDAQVGICCIWAINVAYVSSIACICCSQHVRRGPKAGRSIFNGEYTGQRSECLEGFEGIK